MLIKIVLILTIYLLLNVKILIWSLQIGSLVCQLHTLK